MSAPSGRNLDALDQEALAAARGLTSGDSALAGVLRDLEQERSRAAQAYHAVLRSLAAALEARDGYTGEHSDDVRRLSAAVASRLALDERAAGAVEAVALLHDVGKIGVPDGVLHKAGPLTPDEWVLMREHPVIGERILRPLPGLDAVATAVRHEHERWDGGGYPDGLAGEAIPLASRIVLACDAWHALVSDRPYRAALGPQAAREELRRNAGTQFDPRVVEALLAALDAPGTDDAGADDEDVARALVAPDGDEERGRPERELLALITLASVVGAAHRVDDVVEVAAEQALEAVGAASLSISRWEVDREILRTLINAGELGPGEERLPADEVYPMDEYDTLRGIIEGGQAYRISLDDDDVHPLERKLLEELGKHHCAAVGIRFAGLPWGELWATRRIDQPPFTDRDVRFLHTVSDLIAAAAGRAEVFGRMAELAFEDPLTGVANRRALEERLELKMAEALAAGEDLALLLCDLDGLKELNDGHGHQAGDAALLRVASELSAAAGEGMVARIGGDEFCVLLEHRGAEDARRVGERLLERLASGGEGGRALSASCGVASIGLGARRPRDLLRAADAAQYTAKRAGRGRISVAVDDIDSSWKASSTERRAVRATPPSGTVDVGALLADALHVLDGPFAGRAELDRLEAIALAVGEAVEATAITISYLATGEAVIDTVFSVDRRTWSSSGRRFGIVGKTYLAADYPDSVALMIGGGTLQIDVDDPDADAAERQILAEWGMTGVLMGGTPDAEGGWLIEVFSDGRTAPLAHVAPALRLLAAEAVSPARRPATSGR